MYLIIEELEVLAVLKHVLIHKIICTVGPSYALLVIA
jgi:hypothetical protein